MRHQHPTETFVPECNVVTRQYFYSFKKSEMVLITWPGANGLTRVEGKRDR